MTEIRAHLNGGPMDDQYMVVQQDWLYVRLMRHTRDFMAMPQTGTGLYKARRMFNGDPVPHDLAGTFEFDWDMSSVQWDPVPPVNSTSTNPWGLPT